MITGKRELYTRTRSVGTWYIRGGAEHGHALSLQCLAAYSPGQSLTSEKPCQGTTGRWIIERLIYESRGVAAVSHELQIM